MSQGQESQFIEVSRLKVGLYIYLDLGWMDHPFPLSNFRIVSTDQIATIRSLGVTRVRYSVEQSDATALQEALGTSAGGPDHPGVSSARTDAPRAKSPEQLAAEAAHIMLMDAVAAQNRSLAQCERRFGEATRAYRLTVEKLRSDPVLAHDTCEALVQEFLSHVAGDQESCIRLLSEASGDRAALHSINVTVIAVMLARAVNLSDSDIADVGMAGLLHDIGKIASCPTACAGAMTTSLRRRRVSIRTMWAKASRSGARWG